MAIGIVGLVALGAWMLALRLNSGRSTAPTSSGRVAVAPAVLVQTPPLASDPNAKVGLGTGDLAPNFEASDLNGRRFALSQLRGHPLVVNFWASWCTSCAAEMPAIQSTLGQYRARGLRVLAVNMGDDPGTARGFLQARGVDLPVALDTKLTVARAYRVTGLPVTYFLDAGGVIRHVRFGEMSGAMVDGYASELVASAPAASAPPSTAPVIRLPGDQPATPPATAQPATVKLSVGLFGPGTMLLQSPSLRCGAGFCAGFLLQALQNMSGVSDATSRVVNQQTGDWGFAITYDPALVTPAGVIAVYDSSLTTHPDPLYPLPHRVEIVQAGSPG
ncbi:MAG: TlpA disulfide reductase family protein [Candidatus Limnocylindria bacterium]